MSNQFEISRSKIVKSGKTRWLSRGDVVRVLVQLLPALVQVFRTASASASTVTSTTTEITAAALLSGITSYMFIGILVGMVDLLALLNLLSKSYQHDVMDFGTVSSRLEQVRSVIIQDFLAQKATDEDGFDPNLNADGWNALWNRVLDEGIGSFEEPSSETVREFLSNNDAYHGVEMHSEARSEYLTWLIKYSIAIMSRLAERFPEDDMAIMKALEILNPKKMAGLSKADLKTYGDEEIKLLCEHYGKAKVVDGQIFERYVEPDQLKVE